jgi:hypothetical protein
MFTERRIWYVATGFKSTDLYEVVRLVMIE